ncbi:MAG: RagB/SusD family nutrient uptake outer membrane protein [Bacteroidales bacterium]
MKRINYILLLISLFAIGNSCTNLDETLYSTLLADDYYSSEMAFIGAVGKVYMTPQAKCMDPWGIFGIQEMTTNEAITPVRNTGGLNNGGIFVEAYLHKFRPQSAIIGNAWGNITATIAIANQVINKLDSSDVEFAKKPTFIAEMKLMRAHQYCWMIDFWGNIPFTLNSNDSILPPQMTRSQVLPLLIEDIKQNIPFLERTPTKLNYGRITQGMAYTLLAKIYLNSQEWTGVAKWDECIAACDSVILSHNYSLEADYFKNFKILNESSSENIFILPLDRINGWGWQIHQLVLHPNQGRLAFNITAPLWDATACTEEFYNLYDPKDLRINTWNVGLQTYAGKPILKSDGTQLNYTKTTTITNFNNLTGAKEGEGPRCWKWEFTPDLKIKNETMDNDWVYFRYAEVLLMKVEALMRKNGGVATQEAVDIANQVRRRAFGNTNGDYTTTTLTMDELCNELGREFAYEQHRRTDLIRFGKYGNAWFAKSADPVDGYRKLLPIPNVALSTNPNLIQNTGY